MALALSESVIPGEVTVGTVTSKESDAGAGSGQGLGQGAASGGIGQASPLAQRKESAW